MIIAIKWKLYVKLLLLFSLYLYSLCSSHFADKLLIN